MITGTESPAEAEYHRLRPRLFGIAYRILGSVAEAEDVVQDVWLRWQDYPHETVDNPEAFLVTIATRLALNVAESARKRRETYPGPWLPEPVDTSSDPALGAERAAVLESAVLMLLERLTPVERAAYVLREAFDYPYDQIGSMLQQTPAAVRQLVSRARKHLAGRSRAHVVGAEQRRLLDAFLTAAQAGDFDALETMLTEDARSYSDGGGRVRAARYPLAGGARIARVVCAFSDRFWAGATIERRSFNGQDSAVLIRDGVVYGILTVSGGPDGIDEVCWQLNPDKLSQFDGLPGLGE
ncbi:sigma-70 family RNA polymerase sigma factor [Microlunatus speluncae]|uniref:sigma-70 family RNA polymerase sigma factor n=1 Tax=Microlunatus speluncae TaxID=2594267 RepID=UPI001C2D9D28|nr:sigma-70 family RNA polymerase sigma factor [Microlunatus speluncae]